jgi:hypothetical protein
MSAAAATLRVVGFEPVGMDVPSAAATQVLDLGPARMAA